MCMQYAWKLGRNHRRVGGCGPCNFFKNPLIIYIIINNFKYFTYKNWTYTPQIKNSWICPLQSKVPSSAPA